MLNIPETLIITKREKGGNGFLYLRNPSVVPSQGNLPSLPLV
jgi:hypothetical protein